MATYNQPQYDLSFLRRLQPSIRCFTVLGFAFLLSACFATDTAINQPETENNAITESKTSQPPVINDESIIERSDTEKERSSSSELAATVNKYSAKQDLYIQQRQTSDSTAMPALSRGLASLEAQDYESAIAAFEEAKSLGFINSNGLLLLATAYMENGNVEAATANLEAAYQVNPYNPKVINRLAELSRISGDFDKAQDFYAQAIAASPMYALSYRNRGVLFDLYLQDKAAALADYQKVLELYEVAAFLEQQSQSPIKDEFAVNKNIEKADFEHLYWITPDAKQTRKMQQWVKDLERQVAALERQTEQADVLARGGES